MVRESKSYERLSELEIPVLVANGDADLIVPTPNSFVLFEKIKNARLAIYPGAGHGFLYQYAEEFAKRVNEFLNGE